jgi:response regulator RpfG family c-di-GMP phosphodiesterase
MKTEAPSTTAEILLLSEHAGEVQLVRRAVESNNLSVVQACREVLAYLRREGKYGSAARPDLILLDLELSNDEDCAMLEEIKRDREFKRIPVVVLASNDSYDRILRAYELHANAYVLKPQNEKEFIRVIRATLGFWLKLARLPRE